MTVSKAKALSPSRQLPFACQYRTRARCAAILFSVTAMRLRTRISCFGISDTGMDLHALPPTLHLHNGLVLHCRPRGAYEATAFVPHLLARSLAKVPTMAWRFAGLVRISLPGQTSASASPF